MSASYSYTPPPPPAAVDGGSAAHGTSSSIITVIIIIASAIIVSASIYLLLRYLSRRLRHPSDAGADIALRRDASSNQPRRHVAARDDLLESLPLFTFRSVTPSVAGGDCAVCLSRFEPHDQLRLLPLCCHAFHAACIDTWIVSNQTCPLCRSTVLPSGAEALDKILLSAENRGKNGNGRSFRIEIGNISRRRAGDSDSEAADTSRRRSYSVGSFDYILNDDGYEVSVGCTTHSRRFSDFGSNDKEPSVGIPMPPAPPGEFWLRRFPAGGTG
ncbi:E3 ubiquitin-protein ligase atl4 [Phtheirospermum japonicum]|uniref:E3 ubiquitin-protein ligase atl4 n=1 Tax=Phtheirospermum japonicum TaxID=374723 RepID=A0A830BWA3_9LAMI|nr:E3 ubiquitin-protein ligase atl4 [Phtheirospermum japonicum]